MCNCVDFVGSRLNQLSTTFVVLAIRMQGQEIGLAKRAHRQRRHGDGSFQISKIVALSYRNSIAIYG